MVDTPISKLTTAGTNTGEEVAIISQLSTTITISGTTISAAASDNSFNDSGSGFIAAGFAVDDYVHVAGFTGNAANNIFSAKITALTTAKMTIGGADGDVIVDDAAGETVTITKWVSRRKPISELGSPGLVLLEQHTASASATLDFTTFISATYDEYIFELIDLILATDNVSLLMRMSTDGGSSYAAGASDYAYAYNHSTSAFSAGVGSNGTTSIDLTGGIDNAANNGPNGSVKLLKPGGSGHKNVLFHTSGIKNDNNFYNKNGGGR